MLDEFDDDVEVEDVPNSGERRIAEPAVRPRVARLVSRLYGAAGAPLRTRMLACLVRPLGSLGLAAVASGAFAQLLYRRGDAGAGIPIGDLARYSNDQIFELARFVEQVSPDAIQQVAGLLADNPFGFSAFSAAVAMLLVRAVKGLQPKNAGPAGGDNVHCEPTHLDLTLAHLADRGVRAGNQAMNGRTRTQARQRDRPSRPIG